MASGIPCAMMRETALQFAAFSAGRMPAARQRGASLRLRRRPSYISSGEKGISSSSSSSTWRLCI